MIEHIEVQSEFCSRHQRAKEDAKLTMRQRRRRQFSLPDMGLRVLKLTTSVKYARKHITIGSRTSISNGRARVRRNSRRYEPRRCFASNGERYRESWFRARMAAEGTLPPS